MNKVRGFLSTMLALLLSHSGVAGARNLGVDCFEQEKPAGISAGTNRYLTFSVDGDGNSTLTFDPSCLYGDKKKCSYPQTRWTKLRCEEVVSTTANTISWICSIPTAENCFFARLWTDNSHPHTKAGTFEFDSFRDCWLPQAGEDWLKFQANGMISGCTVQN